MARSRVRFLLLIAATLAAAALLNLLVAWGCMIAAPPILGRTSSMPFYAEPWDRSYPLPPGAVRQRRTLIASPWAAMSETIVGDILTRDNGDGSTTHWARGGIVYAAGWPLHSFVCFTPDPPKAEVRGGFRIPGLTSSLPGRAPRPFPSIPLWPGFLINTAVYAAVVGAAVYILGRLVARHPAGQCQRCGYSLAGLPEPVACPECGPHQSPRRQPGVRVG